MNFVLLWRLISAVSSADWAIGHNFTVFVSDRLGAERLVTRLNGTWETARILAREAQPTWLIECETRSSIVIISIIIRDCQLFYAHERALLYSSESQLLNSQRRKLVYTTRDILIRSTRMFGGNWQPWIFRRFLSDVLIDLSEHITIHVEILNSNLTWTMNVIYTKFSHLFLAVISGG